MVALTSLEFAGAPGTRFVAGKSGPAVKVKGSAVHGGCAEDGTTEVSQQRFETELSVKTFQKSFAIVIDQLDWSKKKDGVPDTTTAAGRCFAHYKTLEGMPGGALRKCCWDFKVMSDVLGSSGEGSSIKQNT